MSGDQRKRLEELMVETGAFQYSPDKPFTLASGVTSPYYFDLRKLAGHPEGINTAAQVLYTMICRAGGINSAGGLESGSIPLATAISQLSHIEHLADPQKPSLSSFYVRKKPKEYGGGNLIEGCMRPPAVIIDDVITTGGSALRAAKAMGPDGCRRIISIIFRGTDEDRRRIEGTGAFEYIYTEKELVERLGPQTANHHD